MTDCRIVFNEQTGQFRVESRRWWGWSFVMDATGEQYLSFDNHHDAQCFVCRSLRRKERRHRRWQVVDMCRCLCPNG